jgi:hypothetical protein
MRIAFMGAAGTGKSTLAKWLAVELGLPMNPHTVRGTAARLGFDNPYDVDRAGRDAYAYALETDEASPVDAARFALREFRPGQTTCRMFFQDELLRDKVRWELANPEFVTDRSAVDVLAYTALHGALDLREDTITHALQAQQRYTDVYACPIDGFVNLDNDPVRNHGMGYHRASEALMRGWCANPTRTLWKPDLAERKRLIRIDLGRA